MLWCLNHPLVLSSILGEAKPAELDSKAEEATNSMAACSVVASSALLSNSADLALPRRMPSSAVKRTSQT